MIKTFKISIIGLGFVGSAMLKSFTDKLINVICYDKYKNIGTFEDTLTSDIMFLALPTIFSYDKNDYDITPILETCDKLSENQYKGVIVIKSTIIPETINKLDVLYPNLNFVHNPEFLTARTAYYDFHNQLHVVLGSAPHCDESVFNIVIDFYKTYYPNASISICSSLESESMKSFVNCFYAVKIQFFSELYSICQKNGCDYNKVKDMMLKNGWINPMHTSVPGNDGIISYGGLCFPKDTNALNQYMIKYDSPNAVLDATINERNQMRDDKDNCQ
jgi:nucleotide sugar dehydrogenase